MNTTMSSAVLRVILGPDSCQRVVFPTGLPTTGPELQNEIKTNCKLSEPFRLQFMDTLFDNSFMNLTSMDEIEDKATVKVIYTTCEAQDAGALSFPCSAITPPRDMTSDSGGCAVIPTSESTSSRSLWPDTFIVPRFSYDAELKLEKAHEALRKNGTLLIPDPKLKSDVLQGLIQEVVKHKVYLTDQEFDQVAKALIMRHPCLEERGSNTGYGGWKTSLKYKLSNYRTHLRKMGCPEVCINALKCKPDGKRSPAFNVKKPKRGEVAYCPSFPLGENHQSLEKMRVELLLDFKRQNNRQTVRDKMAKSFALRRQEILCDAPIISDLQERWPALFEAKEINAEFKRITTMQLQSRFLSQLDMHSASLLGVFEKQKGQRGKKLEDMATRMTQEVLDKQFTPTPPLPLSSSFFRSAVRWTATGDPSCPQPSASKTAL
ncbi:hypothetical protein GOODEAATRI_033740 [Goodea atripinnis]|uniref:Uncharacterized protein n=1 Tax=Goodea atripinnis TaxID=208336 RepID=A0ABV0PTV5_9TELE